MRSSVAPGMSALCWRVMVSWCRTGLLVDRFKNHYFISFHFIMVALWNRADHYIFILWFLSIFYLSFFPRLISAAARWMSTILRRMMWS